MSKKISSIFLLTILTLNIVAPYQSAHAESLKCLTRPALEISLTATKATLEGLQKSLPKQLEVANKTKSQLPAALSAMEKSYTTYKSNPTPENKKAYDKLNLKYQGLNSTYNLQYDLYLGQKKRLPALIKEVADLKIKVANLTKECSKP